MTDSERIAIIGQLWELERQARAMLSAIAEILRIVEKP